MIHRKPLAWKLTLIFLSLFSLSIVSNKIHAQDVAAGKALFLSKCASCHNIFKEGAYPALMNLEQRHKWADHNEILKWAHNPPAYMATDPYTQGLKAKFGS